MAAATSTLAKCVLDFLYGLASAILTMIKNILISLLAFIDAKILELRSIIAMLDVWRNVTDAVWAITEAVLEQLKNALLSGIQELGPAADLCPQFYDYFTDPILALIESFSVFVVQKEKFTQSVSVLALFDSLLVYWEGIKAILVEALVVIDDALFLAKEQEAEALA